MRFIFTLALILGLCTSVVAEDVVWVDQGDGTWVASIDMTAPTTTIKDMLEQSRADHNYQWRYTEDDLDVEEWFNGIFFGMVVTQTDQDPVPGPLYRLYENFWQEFTNRWVLPSSTDKLADGLAVEVPAPPSQP